LSLRRSWFFSFKGFATAFKSSLTWVEKLSTYFFSGTSDHTMIDDGLQDVKVMPAVQPAAELKEIKADATICLEADVIQEKPQFTYQVLPAIAHVLPVTTQVSQVTEHIAVNNRQCMLTPVIDTDSFTLSDVLYSMITEIDEIQTPWVELLDNWLNSLSAPKKRHYSRVVRDDGSDIYRRKCFVKREVLINGSTDGDVSYDPRLISAATDEANLDLSPFIYEAAKRIKRNFTLDKDNAISIGASAEDLGKWRKQFSDNCLIIEIDFSRFDSHVHKGSYDLMFHLYQKIGISNYQAARRAYKAQYHTKGRTRHGVRFEVNATRKSGDPNTSIDNSVINIVMLRHCMQSIGITCKILVCGDDCLIVCEDPLSAKNISVSDLCMRLRDLGYTAKIKLRDTWAEAEYCSGLFWPVDETEFVHGPKIGRRLTKLPFLHRKLTNKQINGYILNAKADCSLLPVLRVYYKHILRIFGNLGRNDTYFDSEAPYKMVMTKDHVLDQRTEVFFVHRYGTSLSVMEAALDKAMSFVKGKTALFHWFNFGDIYNIDCA